MFGPWRNQLGSRRRILVKAGVPIVLPVRTLRTGECRVLKVGAEAVAESPPDRGSLMAACLLSPNLSMIGAGHQRLRSRHKLGLCWEWSPEWAWDSSPVASHPLSPLSPALVGRVRRRGCQFRSLLGEPEAGAWGARSRGGKSLAAHLPSRDSLRETLAAVLGTGSSCCRASWGRVLTLSEVATSPFPGSLPGAPGPARLPCYCHLLVGLPQLSTARTGAEG